MKLYDAVRKADVLPQRILEATRGAILARGTAGVPLLVEQLRSDDKGRLAVGLRVARELAGREVTDALVAELGRAAPSRQALLLLALADRGDKTVLPVVLRAAKSGPAKVRSAALGVLKQLGNVSCVGVLLEASLESDAQVAQTAMSVLAEMPGQDVDDDLAARLPKAEGKTRQVLIELVGRRRIAAASPALLKAADDPDAQIRAAALMALGATVESGRSAGADRPSRQAGKIRGRRRGAAGASQHRLPADGRPRGDGREAGFGHGVRRPWRPAAGSWRSSPRWAARRRWGPSAPRRRVPCRKPARPPAGCWANGWTSTRRRCSWTWRRRRRGEVQGPRDPRLHPAWCGNSSCPTASASQMCRTALEAAERDGGEEAGPGSHAALPERPDARAGHRGGKDSRPEGRRHRHFAGHRPAARRRVGPGPEGHVAGGPRLDEDRDPQGRIRRGREVLDVTGMLKQLVHDFPVITLPSDSYNASFGGDPAPGVVKQLKIRYRMNGKPGQVSFAENATIVLPMPKVAQGSSRDYRRGTRRIS